jgi:hypothetical protein
MAGRRLLGHWGNDVAVRQKREGTLSTDVFDAHTPADLARVGKEGI